MGDAIAQMAQDRLRIQALEVNPPVLFAMKQRSEDDSSRDLSSNRLRPWSGSSVSRNNRGGRLMTFAMVVSVGMLPVLTVLCHRRRKTPGVSCRIRQRLVLVLLVKVHRHRSRRPVPVQLSVFQVSSLYQFQHPFAPLFPSLHHHLGFPCPSINVPLVAGVGRPSVQWVGTAWRTHEVLELDRYSPSFSLRCLERLKTFSRFVVTELIVRR
jgi:uncharacterized membrane protein (UPF0136 family)